jgi:hypothetical protein
MNALNSVLTALTDAFFSRWAGGPAWIPLVVVSAAAGIFAAVVFRFTSPQKRLRRDAEMIQAQLLAMKLFRDDLGVMFGSLGRLLQYTARRLWHSLPPVVVMTPPFVLLLAQLARWYEHAPLVPGDQAIAVLQLADDAWTAYTIARPEAGEGLAIETPSLRDPQQKALYWRIRARQPSPSKLTWHFAQGKAIEKTITIAERRQDLVAIDTTRPGPGWLGKLLHPGERPFVPSDGIRGVSVQYPARSTSVFGLDLPWWGNFLVVSILAALVAGRMMKVQF